MAQIGDLGEKKWKLYIVNKADDPPNVSTKFTDYTNYFIGWSAQSNINKLASFVGTLVSINTTTKRGNGLAVTAATLAKGNLIYLMSGTKLISKFVIQKPKFSTDFTVEVTAVQSTGSEIVNRKLANENMPKIAYEDMTFNSILTSTSSTCQGLLVDGAENTILSSTVSSGADDKYSLDYDYDNRIKAVDKLVNTAGKEWYLEYGINDATPYDEGDTLNIASRQGSSTSTKTFYFTGTNMNAKISEGGEETETNANHIILEGQDQRNNQTTSEVADFTGNYSCITAGKGLDGWLNEDISATSTEIPITNDSFGYIFNYPPYDLTTMYPGGMLIKIDNEAIKVTANTTPPAVPKFISIFRGVAGSEASPHSKGADITISAGIDASSVVQPMRVYVDDVSCYCKTDKHLISIGNETVSYQYNLACPYTTPGADYIIIARAWSTQYAHGDKIIIKEGGYYPGFEYEGNPISWAPSNPHNEVNFLSLSGFSVGETVTGGTSGSTGIVTSGAGIPDRYVRLCNISGDFCMSELITGSVTGVMGYTCIAYHTNSIQQDGLFSKTLSDNTAKNRHMLDLKAQRVLLTKRLPIKRISINVIDLVSIWETVSLGDTITLGDGSNIGFEDGEEVRVTGWQYSFQDGLPSLELFCNDKETRTYPATQSNYVSEKITSEESSTQEPLRFYGNAGAISSTAGSNAKWAQGYKQITQVMTPIDDFDAANKKYVDDATPPPSDNYWCRHTTGDTYVKTCQDDDVLPNTISGEGDTGSFIGRSYCRWPFIYGYNINGKYVCATHGFYGNGANVTHTIYQLLDDNNCPVPPGGTNWNEVKLCGTGGISTIWSGTNYICIDGSGISAGCWESAGTAAIRPKTSRSLYPRNANNCNIGLATCKWNSGYFCGDIDACRGYYLIVCSAIVYGAIISTKPGGYLYADESDISCLCVCDCVRLPVGDNLY